MEIFPIRTDEDHQTAVAEIERLWDAKPGSEAFNRLDVLATLVDAYEVRRWPLETLDPVETLRAEMELNGRSLSDLGEVIGRNRATEVLKRQRPLTLAMVRKLHAAWRIPADRLIDEYPLAKAG